MYKKLDYRTVLAVVIVVIALLIALTTPKASAQCVVEQPPNTQALPAFEINAH